MQGNNSQNYRLKRKKILGGLSFVEQNSVKVDIYFKSQFYFVTFIYTLRKFRYIS
jgi:hypothetical protein